MPVSQRTAAVVGLGNLGGAISSRLMDRGWSLQVADRDSRRVEQFVSQGATPVDPAATRMICFVTPDDSGIIQMLDDGLARALTPDHVVVVHSTILPESARRLADRVGEAGSAFVEAPVSGGAERARSGELTVFAGGEKHAIDAADELLRDIGTQIFVMGGVGSASATKLANQLVLFASTAGLHEALSLTASYGVDDAAVLGALESGLGDTWAGRHWGFFDQLAADYDAAGVPADVRPWAKDLREVVEAGEAAGTPTRLAALLADIVPDFIETHAQAARGRKERE